MTFIKLDDSCPDHPAMVGLSDAAFACWVRGLCYASRHLTDGFLPSSALPRLGTRKAATELVAEGRWITEEARDGWRIHDYEDHQRTREQVQRDRDQWRERQQRHRGTSSASRRDTPRGHVGVTPPEVEVEVEVEEELPPPTPPAPELTLVSVDDAGGFAAWWAGYPRKVAKASAEKAYRSARKRASAGQLTEGLARSVAAWRAEGRATDKIPHAATWLNGDRWLDDLTAERGGAAGVIDRFRQRAEAAMAQQARYALPRGDT